MKRRPARSAVVRRASPVGSEDTSQKQPFFSLGKVVILIAVIAWALAIFVLFRQRQWKGNEQRGVIIVHSKPGEIRQSLSLAILRPEKKIVMLELPADELVDTPFQYGTYTTDALIGLAQLEKLKWIYVQYTLSLEYGVGLDGIIWSDDKPITSVSELRSLALSSVFNRAPNTMSWWDRLTLWRWLQQVQAYEFQTVDVGQYVDGTTHHLDESRYDRYAELYLQDAGVRGSSFAVTVENGSDINGYASRVGRMLGLLGYDLRNVKTVENIDHSQVLQAPDLGPELEYSQQRLGEILSVFPVSKDQSVESEERSQAVIRLGDDQAQLFKN